MLSEMLADETPKMSSDAWIGPVSNLSGMALIASLFYWLLTKRMPKMEKDYRDDIQRITNSFTTEIKAERESREASQVKFTEIVTELSRSTLKSFEEILREVREIKKEQ